MILKNTSRYSGFRHYAEYYDGIVYLLCLILCISL